MAKQNEGPSYKKRVRDEKRGDAIREDNRGIVQVIGGLSFLLLISGYFFEGVKGFIDYIFNPLVVVILISLLYFCFETAARIINLPITGIKKLIKSIRKKS